MELKYCSHCKEYISIVDQQESGELCPYCGWELSDINEDEGEDR